MLSRPVVRAARLFRVPRPARACRAVLLATLLAVGPAAGARAGESESAAAFDVWEYRVRGNTLLADVDIDRAVYAYLGPGRAMADIDKARAALEEAYRGAGYPTVLVDVPEQQVTGGVVQLKVTEGRVDRVLVTGARYYSNGWIRAQVPELSPGRVPQLKPFQDEMQALNARSADRSVTPVLRPGRTPGTVEAELKVADSLPLHASVDFNNRNTADTTATRLNLMASYDNLWQRDHTLALQYQVAPQNSSETQVWAGSYVWRLAGSDQSIAFYAVDSNSDIAAVSDVAVIGAGKVFGVQYALPIRSRAGLYQTVNAGVAYKDFKEVIGFNTAGQPDIQTPISYLNWSVGYNATLQGEKRTQGFHVATNFGIRGLANEPNEIVNGLESGEFWDKREGAIPNYMYFTGRYEISQSVPLDSTLYWTAGGQWSNQPLISNEQFAAGGAESVRGYYEAELLGDYGLQSGLEWQSVNFGPRLWEPMKTLQGLVFVDWASLALHDAQPEQIDRMTIWSAGLGLRASAFGFAAALDWAWPFKDGTTTRAGDDRLLFRVQYGF